MLEYEIKDGFNDVEYCFLITANPIDTESNAMSEEELNRLIMEGGDISEIYRPLERFCFLTRHKFVKFFYLCWIKTKKGKRKEKNRFFLLSTLIGLSKKRPSRILDVIQKTETELMKVIG